ncbi:hypothetical protein BFJ70_g17153 [Fusarium oxysporum]|nr:hypothetical protein BFJ70_g17153 [Fusarium oxysporum]
MQRPNDALDNSLLAFCAIQIRLSGKASFSYHETVRLYNHALSKTITILDSPRVANSDEILAAIVILSTCEVFLLHASTSWNAHAQGISEILYRRRIPEKTSLNWTNLCRRLCIICVIQALFQRRSLILEPDIWRQHIGLPVALGSFSKFLDIIIDIPSVMAGAHTLILHKETDLKQSLQCFSLLHQKFRDLDHWRELHHRSTTAYIQGPLYWSVLSRANNPTDDGYVDKLFPFALMFSSVESACAWVLCSTIMLDVLYTISLLGLSNVSNDKTLPSLTDIIEDKIPEYNASNISSIGLTDADRLARMLCQSIEFCYRRVNGTFGPQMTSYTQSILLRYFSYRGLNRELEWCIAIKDMRGPGTNFDVNVRQFGSAPP